MSQCLRFLYKTNFWNIQAIAIIIMRCVYYNPCTTTFEWAVLVITYSIRYTQFKTLVLQHPTTLLRHVKQHQPWYKTCMTKWREYLSQNVFLYQVVVKTVAWCTNLQSLLSARFRCTSNGNTQDRDFIELV